MAGLGLLLLFYIGIIVFFIVVRWKINTKAGQPGWACLVPFHDFIVLCNIAGKPGWWIFLLLVPILNIVILVKIIHGLSKSFGKEAGFTVGLIFLGFIFYPILAFGDAKYVGPNGVPATTGGPLDHNM